LSHIIRYRSTFFCRIKSDTVQHFLVAYNRIQINIFLTHIIRYSSTLSCRIWSDTVQHFLVAYNRIQINIFLSHIIRYGSTFFVAYNLMPNDRGIRCMAQVYEVSPAQKDTPRISTNVTLSRADLILKLKPLIEYPTYFHRVLLSVFRAALSDGVTSQVHPTTYYCK